MRTIKYTTAFKRDYKREKSGKSRRHAERLDHELTEVVGLLAADVALPRRYADHPLTGDWKDFRDCHIHPDLVLIYRKPDADAWNSCDSARIVSLGSDSERLA